MSLGAVDSVELSFHRIQQRTSVKTIQKTQQDALTGAMTQQEVPYVDVPDIDTLLEDVSCDAIDYSIERFSQLMGKNISREDLLANVQLKMLWVYVMNMQCMTGQIQLDTQDPNAWKYMGSAVYTLFRQVKKKWREQLEDDVENDSFMHRIFPLIEARCPTLSVEERSNLYAMYALVREKFAHEKRRSTTFDGTPITYVTHLKEALLTKLVVGKKVTYLGMMMTLGHDLVEDTSVTLQELKEKFGADVAAHIGILTKKSAKEIAIEKMDYNKSEHYEDPTLPVYVKSVPAVTAHQKEGLFAYITQRKEAKNKLHPRKSIDANLINSYEDLYADLKNIARDIYFERLKKFSEEDIIYYSFSTLLPFSEEEKYVFSDDFGVLDMQEVLMTKCEDVINNLGTMQDDVLGGNRDKIIRKITEAKDHVLPLAKEYCPEYLPALMHWIAYGEAAVEKLKG